MNSSTQCGIVNQPDYSAPIKALLQRRPQIFVNNEWIDAHSAGRISVVDPSTGLRISEIAAADQHDTDVAVAAARIAFDDGRWTALAPFMREACIHRLADLIEENAAQLAELEAIDNGKPRSMAAMVDVPAAIATLRYCAGWATKIGGAAIDPMSMPSGAFHAYVRREPIGVAAQIVPWNFPLLMAISKIAPALAAGCTIILKPAEQTSLSALRLGDLIAESGIPAGVVNILTGFGHEVGDMLVRHPKVDKVAFTGSTEVGKLINRNATDTLKRVTLELGGKSPVVVMPDIELQFAAKGAANGIFFNSGQVCVAGSRLFAQTEIFDRFLELIVAEAAEWTMGPSLADCSRLGPLVSKEQQDRVLAHVRRGRASGASVLIGGEIADHDGYYMQPTVLADVKPDMSVVREEIFGPVIAVQRFDELDEVVANANDSDYGLGASVWTRDLSVMHKLAARIKSGTVWGNCHGIIDAALPFGGVKQSGLGREQGPEGVLAYTEQKSVIIAL